MTMEDKGEARGGRQTKKPLVHIPSHEEVSEHFKPQPPPLLFRFSADAASLSSSLPSTGAAQPKLMADRNSNLAGVQARNAILVSRRQEGNPLLRHIRNVRWMFGDVVPDYVLGQMTCALYLSLRYHLLHPDYLYFRIRELQKNFRLRVVLCHVDMEDVIKPLHEVTKTALLHDCSLICGWSFQECARYLETIKIYEHKPADSIQERTDNDYLTRLTGVITSVRRVNRTDAITLGSTFGSLAAIIGSSIEELASCPGIGERKVKRLYNAFHEPFRHTSKQTPPNNFGLSSSSSKLSQKFGVCGGSTASESRAEEEGLRSFEVPHTSVRRSLEKVYSKLWDIEKPDSET